MDHTSSDRRPAGSSASPGATRQDGTDDVARPAGRSAVDDGRSSDDADPHAAPADDDPSPDVDPGAVAVDVADQPTKSDDTSGIAADDERGRESQLNRWGPALALAVALLVVVVVGVVVGRDDGAPPPEPDIPLDAWAPYWALEDSVPELSSRLGSMREVSPFWFNVVGVDEITVDPNAPAELTESFFEDARRSDALIVPSLVDALPAGRMAAILDDPVLRRRHVQTVVEFAEEGDYDGIDLDYEQFAFADGRETWATTRPAWVSFVEQLARELHADGRTLTVSIPPVYDSGRTAASGFWVYDHGAIAEHVDRIRIMAYDYSVGDPGPIAPLAWVERAVTGVLEATDAPDKIVLGVPAYGRNWPIGVTGDCPAGVEVPDRTSVTARTVDELAERRGAEPTHDPDTAESSFRYTLDITDGTTTCVQTRQVHYVDGLGVRERMDLAREYGLDGVSLWALGFEDEAVWDAILPTVAEDADPENGRDDGDPENGRDDPDDPDDPN